MNDPKINAEEVKEVYGPSVLEDLLELLNDKEDYRLG